MGEFQFLGAKMYSIQKEITESYLVKLLQPIIAQLNPQGHEHTYFLSHMCDLALAFPAVREPNQRATLIV